MVSRAMNIIFMWGPHKLTGSLPEDSHSKSSHIARLGNSWYTANCSASLKQERGSGHFHRTFFVMEAIFRKLFISSNFSLLFNWSSLSFKKFKLNFEQQAAIAKVMCKVIFKMGTSFITAILTLLMPKKERSHENKVEWKHNFLT